MRSHALWPSLLMIIGAALSAFTSGSGLDIDLEGIVLDSQDGSRFRASSWRLAQSEAQKATQ